VLARALPFVAVTSVSPPLSMTRLEAEEAVDRYVQALDAVTGDLLPLAESE
jgi:hypothetical protein